MTGIKPEDIERINASRLFDGAWYLEQYPDVKALGMNPLEHYLWLGARLGRNPGPAFDTQHYLALNADVARAGINPLLHYARWGKAEQRPITATSNAGVANAQHLELEGRRPRIDGGETVLVVAHAADESLGFFGGERSFLDILEGFASIDTNVVAVLPNNSAGYTDEVRKRSNEVVIFEYPWWRRNPASEQVTRKFESIISSKGVHAVHTNTIMLREPLIAARNRNVPSVVHVRELIRHDQWLQAEIGEAPDSIVDQVLTQADWVIANSETTSRAFFKEGHTFVVPNTVDASTMDIPNNVESDAVWFGIISSNIPKKGILDVVELACACESRIPRARFAIIGRESELVRKLRAQQVAGQIPSTIRFPGYAASPREAIEKVNVVLNFSHFAESFGRTVLEAMAARRPVIAYEWGALPELVERDVTGFLIPFRQPLEALPAVRLLCESSGLIEKMGAAARQIAEQRYSKREYARSLQNAYKSILARFDKARINERDPVRVPVTGNKDSFAQVKVTEFESARTRALRPLALRIAYFCWHFPVPSETFVLAELRHLVAQGHDVIVFYRHSPHKDFTPDFPIRGVQVSSPYELAQQLRHWRRDIAHGHFVYPTVTEFLWPACEEANVPFSFIAHAQDIFRYANDQKNRIGDVAKSVLCLRLFVLSKFHREYVIARGVPAEKVVINPNAIDTAVFVGAKSDAFRRQSRAICAVHRFCEKKGLEFLIRAGKELESDGITVDLYGYGPLEERYREIISALGLSNVRLCGPVKSRAELIELFRSYDLFVCPSVRAADGDMDGIPTSVVEAMAAGLPVLTTALSGIPDLVTDGITGLVCEPTPESIATAVRRFYAMPSAQVEAIVEAGQRRVQEKHDVKRLVRVLLRVWANKTIDVVLVSWTHLEEHREVLRRIYEYTSLPFNVIVSANSDHKDVIELLEKYDAEKDNFTLIRNGRNLFVGPATNRALEAGSSDIAIYVCAREGFVLRPGWEIPFIHYMEENPEVGIAGTLCHSPTYLTGGQYSSKIPVFPQFRNPSFANQNSDRIFHHVQGGLFAVRREMYDEIGGFSETVPHDYTDVEYSFYVESCGWKLGQVAEIVSLFNKTRPPVAARIDETTTAVHPATREDAPSLEAIANGGKHNCNLCGWQGMAYNSGPRGEALCPGCGSGRADRTLYRWLTPSIYLHRRLPAIAVGLEGRMEQIWSEHFRGPRLAFAAFVEAVKTTRALPDECGKFHLGFLRGRICAPDLSKLVLAELARLLSPCAILLMQPTDDDMGCLRATADQLGFEPKPHVRLASHTVQFDWVPLHVWSRKS